MKNTLILLLFLSIFFLSGCTKKEENLFPYLYTYEIKCEYKLIQGNFEAKTRSAAREYVWNDLVDSNCYVLWINENGKEVFKTAN